MKGETKITLKGLTMAFIGFIIIIFFKSLTIYYENNYLWLVCMLILGVLSLSANIWMERTK